MSLLGAHDVTLAFGGPPVLEKVGFHVEAGERVALIGRNGCGKSTLLKVLAGDHVPDSGEITFAPGRRIARLPQEVPRDLAGEVLDVVASGEPEVGALLAEYHRLSQALGDAVDAKAMEQLEEVQHRLEAAGGWDLHQRVETVLSRLQLPETGRFETLSGGLSRRVLLARALVADPDVLLLDEPTNHLDIPAIEWLEELILGMGCAVVFVTHDRAFLRRLATRILELDRGRLTDFPGDWRKFQERKAEMANAEAKARDRFDKKLAEEEAWIRQGLKARRARNEGRVRALEAMRDEARRRRTGPGSARLTVDDGGRSGKRVIVAESLAFAFDDKPIVRDFSTTIIRGDKVGLLGPNGSGKTTVLRLLLGELEPQAGTVRHGTNLQVAYFDQLRESLDPSKTVADNVADGADRVSVGGKPRHVISYLADFLFSPEQTRGPVDALSGGERNRLLLARLFTQPFNLLVMDEPTNDLDVETLELLEARLVDLEATLLLVSHDREFLDRVVSSTLVLEGGGRVGDYAGGYSDWLRQRPESASTRPAKPKSEKPRSEKSASRPKPKSDKPKKLSYKETQDLDALPGRIEALETEQAEIHARLADPETYKVGDGNVVAESQARLKEVEAELETAYERWAELEERVG